MDSHSLSATRLSVPCIQAEFKHRITTNSLNVSHPAAASALNEEQQNRASQAVLGALVSDAACLPLHWIYDLPKMSSLLNANNLTMDDAAFFPTPSCPYYKAQTGEQSPYGYELFPLIDTLNECPASSEGFDQGLFAEKIVSFFSSDARKESVYRNQSVRVLLENFEKGKRGVDCGNEKDFQANCFARASILVAKYGSESAEQLAAVTEKAIVVQQNNADAVKYGVAGALILQQVVREGSSIVVALEWASSPSNPLIKEDVKSLITQSLAHAHSPPTEIIFSPIPEYMKAMYQIHIDAKGQLEGKFSWPVWCYGPACGNPAALSNVLMIAAAYSRDGPVGKSLNGGERYRQGVLANLMAGGDNCSRSLLLGALLAAEGGIVPTAWIEKTKEIGKVDSLIKRSTQAT